jgi:hypothetical protein
MISLPVRRPKKITVILPWRERIYALYSGDDFLAEGTIEEISNQTGKSVSTLRFMTYPVYERRCKTENRLKMIHLDDEEDE